MGLKYIEPIKSIILLLLVLMSITFTFSIWTYSPQLAPIDQSKTVDISIGQQKDVKDVIKPYKFLIKYEEELKGTTDQIAIDKILRDMGTWKVSQLMQDPTEMNKVQMKEFFEQPNQFTLYFNGQVPLPAYDEILPIDEMTKKNLPEFSFDRLIVRWDPKAIAFEVHFINRATGIHFYGKANPADTTKSYQSIIMESEELTHYVEVKNQEPTYLAVPDEPVPMVQKTYYQEEISPGRFRDALFNDPNAVKRSQVDHNHEEFGDDHALMVVNTETKMLDFVHPAAEAREPAKPSDLLLDVIDSINEHGGWTDSFRYSYINSLSRYVKFQLFINGYPVHSESDASGLTEIVQFYGDDRVFRYIRPYYTLESSLSFNENMDLPSGTNVVQSLMESEDLDFSLVEELTVGYMMKHDLEQRIFVLEPAWFYLFKGTWKRYTPEQTGGEPFGLE